MLFKIDPGLILKLRPQKLHHFESKMPEQALIGCVLDGPKKTKQVGIDV